MVDPDDPPFDDDDATDAGDAAVAGDGVMAGDGVVDGDVALVALDPQPARISTDDSVTAAMTSNRGPIRPAKRPRLLRRSRLPAAGC